MEKPNPKPAAHPNSIQSAEAVRTHYRHKAAYGVHRADLVRADYWQHLAARLREDDIIEVVADDKSYFATLLVLAAGQLGARVVETSFVAIDPLAMDREPIKLAGYDVLYADGALRWHVKRDKQVVKDKFSTRAEAVAYLENLLKQQAA